MERIWNYFFYCTWKIQISLGQILIEKPLIFLFSLVPFLRNNWNKGENKYKRVMHSKDSGVNLGFSFGFMFLNTLIIYICICLYLVKLLKIEYAYSIYNYFIVVVSGSYLTNYLFLFRSDNYKKYFAEFEKEKNKSLMVLSAVLFHLGVFGFGILSIHFTVGFNI